MYVRFETIKDLGMIAVSAMLSLPLRKEGATFRCECPIHRHGRRSLAVTPAKGRYGAFYCHASGTGGTDCISLAAHVLNCSQHEAACRIAEHFTVPPGARRAQ